MSFVLKTNPKQKGNRVLSYIRNVVFEYDDTMKSRPSPDFEVGLQTCVLFLSLQFHILNTSYIFERIEPLQRRYKNRIILLLDDLKENRATPSLIQLSRVAIENDWTLICSWTNKEAARYLETFCAFEKHSAAIIQESRSQEAEGQATSFLCKIKSLNKTDASSLLSRFGNIASIACASLDDLSDCPGIGSSKATYIFNAFRAHF